MSVEPTISRTAKARFAEQRDRHETHTNQVDVWNDCAYRLMDILGGLGAEPLGDSGIRPDAAQWGRLVRPRVPRGSGDTTPCPLRIPAR